jgi:hypothetical protein
MSVDAGARRAAVLFEIAAHADLYEADVAPDYPRERMANIKAAADRVGMDSLGRPKGLYELAGRVLAWLEHDAKQEQQT